MKQNGRLRKDREDALNAVGFKWQVLSTSSWDDMYNVLCEYVKERKGLDPKNAWDGNVPANYKTSHKPPKALGRWVNRQRSNYSKKRIKKEHIEKLNELGIRWSVHERAAAQLKPNAVPSSQVSAKKKVEPVVKKEEVSKPTKDASQEASKEVSSSDSSSNGAVSSSAVAKENDKGKT
jgi:hypothetical protein